MKKNNKKNIIILIIIFISLGVLIYSGINIYKWYRDSLNIKEINKEIEEKVTIEEVKDEDLNVEIIEEDVDRKNPYWDYIKMNLIDVNFQDLKKNNSDVSGWIQVNGTNINYPYVQTNNNNYYLNHAFDKSFNSAGWVFMDYRNSRIEFNKNTILYAHGRADRIMFNSLKNLLNSSWYQNKDNHIIKTSTENMNALWQVFSVYHIKTTNDYIKTSFESDTEYNSFLLMLKKRSVYNFDVNLTSNDKILTLSTCYNNNEKMVMHAKLIKYSSK